MTQLKRLEVIIPNRWLSQIDDLLKGMQIGGMSATRIEGRGKVKPSPVAIQRGRGVATPEFMPRIKVEVIVREEMVEESTEVFLNTFGGISKFRWQDIHFRCIRCYRFRDQKKK